MSLIANLLPDACAVCDERGQSPCSGCVSRFSEPQAALMPLGVDQFVAAYSYDGAMRELITAMKFRRRRTSVNWMAAQLASRVQDRTFDCITWVPSSWSGRHERGFDSAKLLARAVGRQMNVPAYSLLRRDESRGQTSKPLTERQQGPRLVASARAWDAYRVLLIDDVCTTGATLATSARILKDAGVIHVSAAVLARTPARAAQLV